MGALPVAARAQLYAMSSLEILMTLFVICAIGSGIAGAISTLYRNKDYRLFDPRSMYHTGLTPTGRRWIAVHFTLLAVGILVFVLMAIVGRR